MGINSQLSKSTNFKTMTTVYRACHCLCVVVAETNTWIAANGWKDETDGYVCVANQEDSIKTKNITEKITFDGKCTW